MKLVSPHHRQLYIQNSRSKQRRYHRVTPVSAQALDGHADNPLGPDTNESTTAISLTVRPVVAPSPLGTTSPVMAATTENPDKQGAAPAKKQLVKINITHDRVRTRRARAMKKLAKDLASRMDRNDGAETKIGRFRYCEAGKTTVTDEDGTERIIIRHKWVKVTQPKKTSSTELSDASTQ